MKRVWAVDDDIVMYRLLQMQVKRAGCEGFFFREGKSAIEALPRVRPDLAILDFDLPDTSGAELCARLRATEGLEQTPVIFVTGTLREEDRERIRQIPNATMLSKPFSPHRLRTLIGELLG